MREHLPWTAFRAGRHNSAQVDGEVAYDLFECIVCVTAAKQGDNVAANVICLIVHRDTSLQLSMGGNGSPCNLILPKTPRLLSKRGVDSSNYSGS
jgi:hypothetical protein